MMTAEELRMAVVRAILAGKREFKKRQKREKSCEKKTATDIIAGIPNIVKEAVAKGDRKAMVMETEFSCVEDLEGVSKTVYAHCRKAGLNPQVAQHCDRYFIEIPSS